MKILKTLPGDVDFQFFEILPQLIYDVSVLHLKQPESVPIPYLMQCYVAIENEIPIARLSLYLNPELIYDGKQTASIGNYECVENQVVSRELIQFASQEARELGAEFLIGPMNGSTWENYRFSSDHNHPNFFLEPYHHLYYKQQFIEAGFKSIGNYFSLLDQEVVFKLPEVKKKEVYFENLGVRFKEVNLDDFENTLAEIYTLNVKAFKTNFLYTPISKLDFIEKYLKAKQYIQAEFLILAYSSENELIGYYFCMPDLFNQKEKSLIIKSIARIPDEKYRGLGNVIGHKIYTRAQESGYVSIIHAFIHDNGSSAPISEQFSENKFKKYSIYGKAI